MNSRRGGDICQTSLDILEAKCSDWFARNFPGEKCWMPDVADAPPQSTSGEVVHVILAGGFLRRFLESGNWNLDKIKLWALSHATKRVLSQVLGIPSDLVGVIPRTELFPAPIRADAVSDPFPGPPLSPTFDGETWVFAGRLSPTKNLEMLIYTVWFLQTEYGRNLRLELIGDFDDQAHPDDGVFPRPKYKPAIEALIAGLNWKIPPVIRPKTTSNAWLEADHQSPRFVSFSTFISEDFGVALAQAQAAGWPTLTSDWGGHAEAWGLSDIKFPWVYAARAFEPEGLIRLKARQLSARLEQPIVNEKTLPTRDAEPRETSIQALDGLRRKFLAGLGPDSASLYRQGPAFFASTAAGRNFFSRYRLAFAGPLDREKPWCILFDEHHAAHASPFEAHAHHLLDRAFVCGRPAAFLKLKDLGGRDTQWTLLNAHRVILPAFSERAAALAARLPAPYEIAEIP